MSDFSLTTFGQKGELAQVTYALNAVAKGETTVGVRAKNGVVIAAEKKVSSILVDESSVHKVDKLCDYMGATYSGIGPDFQAVLLKARKDIQVYHTRYQDRMNPFMISKSVADVFQNYTQSGGVRPFGISLMIAGCDENDGPQIFQVEASGTFFCWKATALGKGASEAKSYLEKVYTDDMDIGDAVHTAIKALKNSFEGEMTSKNIEVGILKTTDAKKEFHVLSTEEIADLLREVD